MTRAVLVLLLLAGCARVDADPLRAQCEGQADQDPAVRDLLMKSSGSPQFLETNQDLIKDTRQRAINNCLRARGVLPPGGVEAPQRSRSLFNGLF